jgi:membrane protease YdiL (CAAX protease family)
MALTPKIKLGDIFPLMIQVIIVEIVVVVLLQALKPSPFITTSLATMVGSLWWIIGYQRQSRIRGWESLKERFSPVGGWIILASALGGLFLILLPSGLAQLLELAGIKIPNLPPQAVLPSNLLQLPLAIAVVVVLGPLSEELFFRGLLLDWLRQKMAVWPAAIVISLFFALLHNLSFKNGILDWIAFGVRFLLSAGASFFAIRYRSLRPSFVMHAVLNGCVCLVTVLRGGA